MTNYKYDAKDLAGQTKKGTISAASEEDAMVLLRDEGLIPDNIKEEASRQIKTEKLPTAKKVKSSELASFCWQLCVMLEGGIPLITAIETIAEDSENKNFQIVLEHVVNSMQKGATLHASMKEFPKVFDNLFCSLIMAGETGGALPSVLDRLAGYADSRDKLMRQVRTAMAYPAFVLGFAICLIMFIMIFIIPRFKIIFESMGGELPLFTRIFMRGYDLITNNVLTVLLLVAAAVVGWIFYSRTEKGSRRTSKVALKLPLVGKVKKQVFVAMFCKTFATLLATGVAVLDALEILSTMSNNAVMTDAVSRTREHIVKGSGISISMTVCGFFPKLLTKMVKVGEESGSLPNVLDKTSTYYERRVESTIATVLAVLEPMLIVTVGTIVLVVLLALYMPIFNLSTVWK